MKRREFIALAGGAAATWPVAARAQQAFPIIGYLDPRTPEAAGRRVDAFLRGLAEAGFTEGRNVTVERRFAHDDASRLPDLAADLVRHNVAVIGAATPAAIEAARAATSTIPIIFAIGSDPVALGYVRSIRRPGGNITGMYFLVEELSAKGVEILCNVAPAPAVIGALIDPRESSVGRKKPDILATAGVLGRRVAFFEATTSNEIIAALDAMARQKIGAIFVSPSPSYVVSIELLVKSVLELALPAMFPLSEFTRAGGLMSYGTDVLDAQRQAGLYAARVLKGGKPADLPVQQSMHIELAINMKTAAELGVTFPVSILGRADEVIE